MRNDVKQKNKKIFIVAAVLILLAAAVAIYFALNPTDSRAVKNYENLAEENSDKTLNPLFRRINFKNLQAVNPDIKAWIYIPGTNIDYPIAWSEEKDDAYYLTTTYDGKNSRIGTVYMEKYNKIDFSDPVSILYGHTFFDDTDAMFTQIHKYEDPNYIKNYPYIYIYTPKKAIQYQIFNTAVFDNRYLLGAYSFTTKDGFNAYLEDLKKAENAVNIPEVNIKQKDGILTLSTCIEGREKNRFLVSAAPIEDMIEIH